MDTTNQNNSTKNPFSLSNQKNQKSTTSLRNALTQKDIEFQDQYYLKNVNDWIDFAFKIFLGR